MKKNIRTTLTAAVAGASFAIASAASAKSTTFVDLGAGLGYSTNPLLRQDGDDSAFGRLSIFGQHSWTSERGLTSISAYVENTTYLKDYGSKQLFNLNARTNQNLNSSVSVYGDIGFSGDIAGQLSNRLLPVPGQTPVVNPPDPSIPPDPVVPGSPLPPTINVPDVLGLSGRQYRLNGQVGASIRASNLSTISLSAGASRIFFSGDDTDNQDYNIYFGSVGYSRQISERTSAGGTLSLQRQDFNHGDYSNLINPNLTVHTQLNERFAADASVGVLYVEESSFGHKRSSWSPSFSGSLCRAGTLDRFCARLSRDASSALVSRVGGGVGGTSVSTAGSLDYFRLLGEGQTIQFALSGVRYSTPGLLDGDNIRSTYLSAVGNYDRKIGHRLYAGISVGARRLFQVGPDPDVDLNASVSLRYRLGDLL